MLAFSKLYQFNERLTERAQEDVRLTIPCMPMETDLATVERTVSHRRVGQIGRVLFQGVSWQARCIRDLTCPPGFLVRVLYRKGNTLMVDAITQSQLQQVA